jgi:hypothetical protein
MGVWCVACVRYLAGHVPTNTFHINSHAPSCCWYLLAIGRVRNKHNFDSFSTLANLTLLHTSCTWSCNPTYKCNLLCVSPYILTSYVVYNNTNIFLSITLTGPQVVNAWQCAGIFLFGLRVLMHHCRTTGARAPVCGTIPLDAFTALIWGGASPPPAANTVDGALRARARALFLLKERQYTHCLSSSSDSVSCLCSRSLSRLLAGWTPLPLSPSLSRHTCP